MAVLIGQGKIDARNRAADQVVEHLIGLEPSSDLPGEDPGNMMPRGYTTTRDCVATAGVR